MVFLLEINVCSSKELRDASCDDVTCKLSTEEEAKAGRPKAWGQPGLHIERFCFLKSEKREGGERKHFYDFVLLWVFKLLEPKAVCMTLCGQEWCYFILSDRSNLTTNCSAL